MSRSASLAFRPASPAELPAHPFMTRTTTPAAALVALLVLALAAPAAAQSSAEDKRDAARSKKTQLAAQIDTLRADNDALENAVRALDAGVQVASSDTDSAQQALRAAQTGLTTAESKLVETEKRMADLRYRASAAAVRAYVHPGGDSFLDIVRSRDLGEASRRQTLLSTMVSNDRDLVEQMRAARQDQQFDQANLAKARDLAAERRKAAADKLAELERTRADQVRLKSALDGRIAAFVAEADAAAREEASLTALLRQRQAAAAAPAPAQASRGGGAARGGGASQARAPGAGGMVWPTAGGTVTSPFGARWGRMHTGLDIANSYGEPVFAAKGGTVIQAGSNGGYGISAIIDHGGGVSTLYAHMSAVSVADGTSVDAGQRIGSIGSTGNSTGNHVHFEVRVGGTAQDPMRYLG